MEPQAAKYWEIISFNLMAAGWSHSHATFDQGGREMHRVEARHLAGPQIIVQADDILAAFLEFEAQCRAALQP